MYLGSSTDQYVYRWSIPNRHDLKSALDILVERSNKKASGEDIQKYSKLSLPLD